MKIKTPELTTETYTENLARKFSAMCLEMCLCFVIAFTGTSLQVLHADPLNDLITGGKSAEEKPADNKVISTENTRQSDREIRKRLQGIYIELDTLKNLAIDVSKGVVTLKGEVTSSSEESKALELARQIEGVVEVENELVVTRSVEKRLETTWNKVQKLGKQVISALPLLVVALLVFVAAWLLGRWLSRRQGFFRRITPNHFIASLLGQITHLILIVIGLVLALSLLDATALLGTIMGAAGIFGLAIGFAVRDTVENYIASILLSLRNPFQVNDYVDVNGNKGNVARLTTRATILISADGNHVRIPNAEVFKAVIVNYTRNPERRFEFDLGVDAAEDLSEAQQLAIDTLNGIEGVLADPKPLALVESLGDFNVIIRVYGWVNQDNFSFAKVRSEAIKKTKQAFDEAGILMPEPIYQVRVSDASQLFSATATQAPVKPAPQSLANKTTKTAAGKRAEARAEKPAPRVEVPADLKPDDTAKEKVQEEFATGDNENLLNKNAPSE